MCGCPPPPAVAADITEGAVRLLGALDALSPPAAPTTGLLAGLRMPDPPAAEVVPIGNEAPPAAEIVPSGNTEAAPPAPAKKKRGPYSTWAKRAAVDEPDERGIVIKYCASTTVGVDGVWRAWHKDAREETTIERPTRDEAYVLAYTLARMLTPEGCAEIERELMKLGPKLSFAEFFKQAWKVLEPSTDLVWNWHMTLLCCVAQAVFFDWLKSRKDPKYVPHIVHVLVNVCPGTSKSKIFSVALLAWIWVHWPGFKAICLSVNNDAAMRDARDMRKLISSDWYRNTFDVSWKTKDDQDAVSNFGNTAGGERLSMPSKAVVVGLRGDGIFVDDANDPNENDNERKQVNDNWDGSQANRVNDLLRSLRFGVQQRTGAGDWSEHVLMRQGVWAPNKRNGWLHVVLPAEFDPARKFVMPECLAEILRECLPDSEILLEDPRTVYRETLDKQRMPSEAIENERRRWEGTGSFDAQMNQAPARLEGSKVKREYWNWFRLEAGVRDDIDEETLDHPRPAHCVLREKHPAHLVPAGSYKPGKWDFDWITLSVDCAVKSTDKGSNWGMVFVAGKDGKRYVLDDTTCRGDILEIIEVLRAGIKKWKPDTILIEEKAAVEELRKSLLREMTKGDMPMVEIILLKPRVGGQGREQGKEQRLDACLPQIANRLVYLLDGAAWLKEFVDELAAFPHGRRNDRVDCLSQALNYYVESDGDDWPDM